MINLPLNDMVKKTGCRYMLVTAVAQRARQLQADPEKLGDRKPVSVAVNELLNDELSLEFPKEYYQE
ncbi:MAG: DNA-directed RNA polymerase subunit omega [Clostridia bacterium]|nr:DNA-directed RNA polymerase subunit omega [Clostridia bacterium]